MSDDEHTEILREAVRLLKIIARPQLNELRERFETAMLTSAKRKEMWELMDGKRSLTDIAKKVGVSNEAVRKLASEIEASWPDAAEVRRIGRSLYIRSLI